MKTLGSDSATPPARGEEVMKPNEREPMRRSWCSSKGEVKSRQHDLAWRFVAVESARQGALVSSSSFAPRRASSEFCITKPLDTFATTMIFWDAAKASRAEAAHTVEALIPMGDCRKANKKRSWWTAKTSKRIEVDKAVLPSRPVDAAATAENAKEPSLRLFALGELVTDPQRTAFPAVAWKTLARFPRAPTGPCSKHKKKIQERNLGSSGGYGKPAAVRYFDKDHVFIEASFNDEWGFPQPRF